MINKKKQKEETIPLNEDEEQEIKANIRTKRKLQENNEKKQENKTIDTNLYHNLTNIMTGLNNLRRKKSK